MRQILITLLIGFVLPLTAQTDDFGHAQWIGAITRKQAKTPEGRLYQGAVLKETRGLWQQADTLSRRSIILRRDFLPKKPIRKAMVYICGLGFYELTINGKKVGNAEFAPLWSDYDKSVFYNTYDVTAHLSSRKTQNSKLKTKDIIQVLLGNGFYNEQGGRYHKLKISFGPPTLLFRMHVDYQDGSEEDVVSDASWQWAPSPITFNSIYGGEDYDARLEALPKGATPQSLPSGKENDWKAVVVQEAPKGILRKQIAKPVKIMERYAVKDTVRKDSVLVLDMGQNLAGFPEITVQGQAGQSIKLTPGETLTQDNLVNQKQTGRPHFYTYILRGKHLPDTPIKGRALKSHSLGRDLDEVEVWHPRFSYYGFRYLQVEGDIEVLKKVESCFVYNSALRTGTFECSNPLLNDTHRLIDRAIRSNWQSVWTDCPAREKLGWLEQDWLNGEGLLSNYDCRSMLEQTMQNIVDAQHDDGSMPEIAPEYTVFTGSWARPFQESPEWGGAIIALPFLYRDFYGDSLLIKRHHPQMKRYVDYLHTQDSCYILRQGLGDWYDFGPGRAGFAQNTPMPLVSTAHYYWWNHLMGEPRADSIRTAFIREFYDPTTHRFGTGSQCAQAIALEMDLVPEGDREAVLQQLIADIHAHGDRLTTGDVGNRYLFNALIHNGQQELLYKMLNHYDVPGYGYQIKKGMTTLTEQWNPEHGASMNHFMMGHINNLLIPYILGIWRHNGEAVIAPHPMGDLTWCRGESNGIKVSWRITGDTFVLDIDIPEGTTAAVILPYSGQHQSIGAGHHQFFEGVIPSCHYENL